MATKSLRIGDDKLVQHVKKWLNEVKELVCMCFLGVFIMTFIISHNTVPTSSMMPTLMIKDHLLVSMLSYYYRSPKRGEVVIFNGPDGEKWIKRVIGLPGEIIDIRDGNIYINGKVLDESAYLNETGISGLNPVLETVVAYPYTIPKDHYFLLGDNRLESKDCRYFGAVPDSDISGRAIFKIYPFAQAGKINGSVYPLKWI